MITTNEQKGLVYNLHKLWNVTKNILIKFLFQIQIWVITYINNAMLAPNVHCSFCFSWSCNHVQYILAYMPLICISATNVHITNVSVEIMELALWKLSVCRLTCRKNLDHMYCQYKWSLNHVRPLKCYIGEKGTISSIMQWWQIQRHKNEWHAIQTVNLLLVNQTRQT